LAVANGIVSFAGNDGSKILGDAPDFYGNVVVIEHDFLLNGQPVYTLYGHLSESLVEEGQAVNARDVIGLSGSSGVADGAHLHFEVRVGNNDYQSTRNPLLWLYPFPDRGVVSGTVTWPDGGLADEVPLTLRRLDAPSPYRATTTYASKGLNPDDGFQENYAFDDVDAGFYEISAGAEGSKIKITFWVYPYQTSFVDINLGG
jgi:murein DD-endopeptidase MepM/ murein hydrolase activator NlpD